MSEIPERIFVGLGEIGLRYISATIERERDDDIPYVPEPRWVPVSERLPKAADENGFSNWHMCIVENSFGEEFYRRCFYDYPKKRWWFGDSPVQAYTVLLWLDMPLPEPPAGE